MTPPCIKYNSTAGRVCQPPSRRSAGYLSALPPAPEGRGTGGGWGEPPQGSARRLRSGQRTRSAAGRERHQRAGRVRPAPNKPRRAGGGAALSPAGGSRGGTGERGAGQGRPTEARSQRSATPDTQRGGLPGNRPTGRRAAFRRSRCEPRGPRARRADRRSRKPAKGPGRAAAGAGAKRPDLPPDLPSPPQRASPLYLI